MTGLALIRIFVGYLWFQQLFWKMPPDFAELYPYIIRESQGTINLAMTSSFSIPSSLAVPVRNPPPAARCLSRLRQVSGPQN
jgi:hypothetical protein